MASLLEKNCRPEVATISSLARHIAFGILAFYLTHTTLAVAQDYAAMQDLVEQFGGVSECTSGWRGFVNYGESRLLEVLAQELADGAWQNITRFSFTYQDDLQTEAQSQRWEEDRWVNEWRSVYDYDQGRLISFTGQEWAHDRWETVVENTCPATGESPRPTWDCYETHAFGDESEVDVVCPGWQMWDDYDSVLVTIDSTAYIDVTIEQVDLWMRWESLLDLIPHDGRHPYRSVPRGVGLLPVTVLFGPDSMFGTQDSHRWESTRSSTAWDNQGLPIAVTDEHCCWVVSDTASYSYESRRALRAEGFIGDQYGGTEYQFSTSYEYASEGNLSEVASRTDHLFFGETTYHRTLYAWGAPVARVDEFQQGGLALDPAYPNPFVSSSILSYNLQGGFARIAVYDMLGRQVATLAEGIHTPGVHRVTFDATDLPNGNYIIRLQAGDRQATRFVTFVR